MRIPRKVIEASLKQKGFVQDNRDHRKFFLYYKYLRRESTCIYAW
jgi:hypothetical protein